jgi:hypothetical protein
MKLLLTVAIYLFGLAHAQFYVGLPGSTLVVVPGGTQAVLGGVQVGNHKATGDFGYRVMLSGTAGAGGYLIEFGTHTLYTAGGSSIFYVGAGTGYTFISAAGSSLGSIFLEPVIGGDFDTDSEISYFIEGGPRYYLDSTLMVVIRSGLNFRFGGSTANRAALPVITDPSIIAAVSPSGTPTVVYDKDGNRYLVPYEAEGE